MHVPERQVATAVGKPAHPDAPQAARLAVSQAAAAWPGVFLVVRVVVAVVVDAAAWVVAALQCHGLSLQHARLCLNVACLDKNCSMHSIRHNQRSAMNPMAALLQQQQMASARA